MEPTLVTPGTTQAPIARSSTGPLLVAAGVGGADVAGYFVNANVHFFDTTFPEAVLMPYNPNDAAFGA